MKHWTGQGGAEGEKGRIREGEEKRGREVFRLFEEGLPGIPTKRIHVTFFEQEDAESAEPSHCKALLL
ncbi:MAG: hypothetical protein LAT83_13370 [Kiritimatiellae bacterium]|nr:hypothetical protein [Kiritimatiellia bacterium]